MKRAVLIALLGIASACGSPSSPSGTSDPGGGGLPFQATRYFLEVVGVTVPCGDARTPQAGTFVRFVVNLTPDSSGWTARSEDGGFTMRLEHGGQVTSVSDILVRGTAQGGAGDQGSPQLQPPFPPSGTRMTIASPIAIAATMPSVPAQLQLQTRGTFNGPVEFSRNGLTATCPSGSVSFTMSQRP